MFKLSSGNRFIAGAVAINIFLWLIFVPFDVLQKDLAHTIAEIVSSIAMILMSTAIVLATKPRWAEPYFGGLDKMYKTHRTVSTFAFIALVLHVLLLPPNEAGGRGILFGKIAYFGIVSLVVISLAPRIPVISRVLDLSYHRWRVSHKLIGVFFIIGFIHIFMVEPIALDFIPGIYVLVISGIGIAAYVYKQLIERFVKKPISYQVSQIKKLNGTCTEVTLRPSDKDHLGYQAGQFLFVSFPESGELNEPHPFTISSAPSEDVLRLSIKSSGDWTSYMTRNLKNGEKALVDGPYGRFNYLDGGQEQIWIGAGIGVTPFASWTRQMNGECDRTVDFFYGARSAADAMFWDEFLAASEQNENYRTHLQLSSVDGHLSADKIAENCQGNIKDKHIYMCGPAGMIEGFSRAFQGMGIPESHIHFEEFNFR